MKLGIVCHPTYGGSGVVASELGLALAKRGHMVHFISHELPFRVPPSHPNTAFHKVDVTSYPLFKYPPYTLALASKLGELCQREGLDIIHVHYAIPHAISAYLCRKLVGTERPKIVTTLHGTDITLIGIDSSFYEMTRLGINESDVVTAVSHSLAEETKNRFGPCKEIREIPNFVNLETFSPGLRNPDVRALYGRSSDKLIGHMSNFRSVKRVPDVIRTFHLIQKHVPARLVMIGDGVELEPARHLAAELGIHDRVEFLGRIPNAGEVLAQLDLFLLPSEHESFGLAALEAMACGVPVIATHTGGLPEVVDHEVNGLLCDVGDFSCMGQSGIAILKDSARHKAMALSARRRAAERFDEPRIVKQYEALYKELLEE